MTALVQRLLMPVFGPEPLVIVHQQRRGSGNDAGDTALPDASFPVPVEHDESKPAIRQETKIGQPRSVDPGIVAEIQQWLFFLHDPLPWHCGGHHATVARNEISRRRECGIYGDNPWNICGRYELLSATVRSGVEVAGDYQDRQSGAAPCSDGFASKSIGSCTGKSRACDPSAPAASASFVFGARSTAPERVGILTTSLPTRSLAHGGCA